jgi:isopentenyl phosphate kinase
LATWRWTVRGGTIVSTEEIFDRLVDALAPARIVLAGEVDGIFTADPQLDPTAQPITAITPATLSAVAAGLGSSHGVDVTGGMRAKVQQSLAMVRASRG